MKKSLEEKIRNIGKNHCIIDSDCGRERGYINPERYSAFMDGALKSEQLIRDDERKSILAKIKKNVMTEIYLEIKKLK